MDFLTALALDGVDLATRKHRETDIVTFLLHATFDQFAEAFDDIIAGEHWIGFDEVNDDGVICMSNRGLDILTWDRHYFYMTVVCLDDDLLQCSILGYASTYKIGCRARINNRQERLKQLFMARFA